MSFLEDNKEKINFILDSLEEAVDCKDKEPYNFGKYKYVLKNK